MVYGLLRSQDTRWSSWLYAAQRLLLLRAYVDLVISQEASFWSGLEEVVAFLKPFQVATDVTQQDGSTLFDVWRVFKRLRTHVGGVPPTNPFFASKEAIITIIIDLWDKHVNIDAVIACAQLSSTPPSTTSSLTNCSTPVAGSSTSLLSTRCTGTSPTAATTTWRR